MYDHAFVRGVEMAHVEALHRRSLVTLSEPLVRRAFNLFSMKIGMNLRSVGKEGDCALSEIVRSFVLFVASV